MWPLDERGEDEPIDETEDDALDPRITTAPHTLSLGEPGLVAGNIAEPVWRRWREEIAGIGGRSSLVYFDDSPRTRIDLSSTHPGGLPPFITGRNTLLSSLIRDELALRTARIAANAITQKGIELRAVRGIDSVHLGIGLARWRAEGDEFTAPVLLRPLAIRRYGRDFELKLRGAPFLNPEMARLLHEQFHITLDAAAFVALAESNGAFKPQPVIDRLRGLTAHLPWFQVSSRLVVSTFADVAAGMLADTAEFDHPTLDALAGNPGARRRIEEAYAPIETLGLDERPPATDLRLLDADREQDEVIAQIAAGNSLVVKTLPGTGATQTQVNAIGALIANGKRVLVVSPRRASLDSIHRRLTSVGLSGVAATPRTARRDLTQAITRNEKATQPKVGEVDDALVRLRTVLLDYRAALTRKAQGLGVSVLDALEELARLALLPEAPSTTARLERGSLEALASGRERAARTLIEAAALGQFRYGPDDSPWYGASFDSTSEANAAHESAKRLNATDLPRLLDRANALVAETPLRDFETIAELGTYLSMLADIRESLDLFRPTVFDQSVSELIDATAPRRDSPQLSGATRRRLRRIAAEYVRPGVHVTDLHGALVRVHEQRTLWNRYAVDATPPQVPVGIADVHAAYQRVAEGLARLDDPLDRADRPTSLLALRVPELVYTVSGLAAESEVLTNLQERTALMATLRNLRLDPLLGDLSARHVPESLVGTELELAWWQSALEVLLESDRALLGANTPVISRLEADFRLVDDAHAQATGQQLAFSLAELWKIGLVDWPEETDRLRRLLRGGAATPVALMDAAPHLVRALSPVWLASPYEVPALPAGDTFDAVFLVDAGAVSVAEAVGVIRRAKQIVAFGDPVTQTPASFTIAIDATATEPAPETEGRHADSALARLGELLPLFTLTRSYRAGGEDLAELVNRRFYGDRIESLPWAGTFLGSQSLSMHFVTDGHGMPDADTGAVESTDAEVARVVELVVEHAIRRSRESLMVITASAQHAVRVHQAVLSAFAARKDLADFILGDRAEPFTVITLEQSLAQSRDRVIFSIGYGRTPHGRLLSNFGSLAEEGGERLLAVGMSRARRSMDLVSCFRPEDIDPSRMPRGITSLAQVLAEAEALTHPGDDTTDTEPLLVDLARRLRKRGLLVRLGYRGALALVASWDGKAVALDTDQVVSRSSLRESLRLRPEMLRRLGWHYLRVHSFELFADPDAVVVRIGRLLGMPEELSTDTAPLDLPSMGLPPTE